MYDDNIELIDNDDMDFMIGKFLLKSYSLLTYLLFITKYFNPTDNKIQFILLLKDFVFLSSGPISYLIYTSLMHVTDVYQSSVKGISLEKYQETKKKEKEEELKKSKLKEKKKDEEPEEEKSKSESSGYADKVTRQKKSK
jgi:hypothetical protein